jgi:hypothetical protein
MRVKDDSQCRPCLTKLGTEEYFTNEVANPVGRLSSSVEDPDPPASAFIWLSMIRIQIGNADPGAWKLAKINK